jgi:hypothetical protein
MAGRSVQPDKIGNFARPTGVGKRGFYGIHCRGTRRISLSHDANADSAPIVKNSQQSQGSPILTVEPLFGKDAAEGSAAMHFNRRRKKGQSGLNVVTDIMLCKIYKKQRGMLT